MKVNNSDRTWDNWLNFLLNHCGAVSNSLETILTHEHTRSCHSFCHKLLLLLLLLYCHYAKVHQVVVQKNALSSYILSNENGLMWPINFNDVNSDTYFLVC